MAYFSGVKEEALPVELTDEICSYLDAEDLLRLSATNTFWRNAVNRDYIWKSLCVRYFDVNPSEKPLIERKCRVEPPFETVTNSSQKLSDICVWRIRFAQEIYVLNNWKHKRFHTENVPEDIPRLLRNSYFIYGNFAVFRTHAKNVIQIWKLTDDGFIKMEPIVFHDSEVINVHPLRNGFVIISSPFIYYYVLDEDGFQLKIRSLVTKALHPEIPLLADTSHFQEYQETRRFFNFAFNNRYLVFMEYTSPSYSFIIWDLQNFTTFSHYSRLEIGTQNIRALIFLAEGESPILYFCLVTVKIPGPLFIMTLKIENYGISVLYRYSKMLSYYNNLQIVGDSLALNCDVGTRFFKRDGTIRTVVWPFIKKLINCRSFFVGRMRNTIGLPIMSEVITIDKKSFSVKIIRGDWEGIYSYVKGGGLDCFFLGSYRSIHTEDFGLNLLYEYIDEPLDENNCNDFELYDLKKPSTIITWRNLDEFLCDFYSPGHMGMSSVCIAACLARFAQDINVPITNEDENLDLLDPPYVPTLHFMSNSNKIIVTSENVFYFW